ncbi:iron-sulfur cluster insertion protein ErpA [Gammaproteobacteria bacterium]|jgi:iron-sulfur cluster insertion protein|nr:iron-sulfur cluster insertion protein ErpA [Gammaproteobacteria bacterium]MBT6043588.1 iron-sulfur cluster insertion protein ErpA [Gammaproteobacteria bacterium]MDA9909113.1 iron-sulfur cluster insertion protein ErpA [Gammaproteobacteria bacterium]
MTAAENVNDPVVGTHDAVAISLTDNASKKVKALITEEGNPALKLRVFVTGGGCSGFQYGFSFDENSNEDDTVIRNNGAELLVDPLSFQYLVGSRVDYTEGLDGSKFIVDNPLATTTCGCGMSFSM